MRLVAEELLATEAVRAHKQHGLVELILWSFEALDFVVRRVPRNCGACAVVRGGLLLGVTGRIAAGAPLVCRESPRSGVGHEFFSRPAVRGYRR